MYIQKGRRKKVKKKEETGERERKKAANQEPIGTRLDQSYNRASDREAIEPTTQDAEELCCERELTNVADRYDSDKGWRGYFWTPNLLPDLVEICIVP